MFNRKISNQSSSVSPLKVLFWQSKGKIPLGSLDFFSCSTSSGHCEKFVSHLIDSLVSDPYITSMLQTLPLQNLDDSGSRTQSQMPFSSSSSSVYSGLSGGLDRPHQISLTMLNLSDEIQLISVKVCLALCSLVMSWRLIQGGTLPSPSDSWERLQMPPVTLIVLYKHRSGSLSFTLMHTFIQQSKWKHFIGSKIKLLLTCCGYTFFMHLWTVCNAIALI